MYSRLRRFVPALLSGWFYLAVIVSMQGEDEQRVPDQSVVLDGVNFNYVDWGGDGEPLVLLAGFHLFGDCAREFDQFAPMIRKGLHVLGFSRRGSIGSDKPADGYDTANRVEDLRRFWTRWALRKPVSWEMGLPVTR